MSRAPSYLLFVVLAFAPVVAGQTKPPPPASPLTVEEVTIDPAAPGPDTLCKLRVKVRNGGERIASRLAFDVTINGQALPVYGKQLFLQNLPPGEVSEVRLYNFWTTETTRPAPKDRKLAIAVALREASWVEVKTEEGIEVSRPLGPVPGLPVAKTIHVTLKK